MKGGMTVADVMQRDVLTVPPTMTIRELSRTLTDAGISGAPVVNSQGATVGVVSATDILRVSAEAAEIGVGGEMPNDDWAPGTSGDEDADLYDFFIASDAPLTGFLGQNEPISALDGYTVQDIMTPATFTLPPTASITELAEFLLRGRIHRALVEEDGVLQGIVTSFDVLKAVVGESG